MALTVRRERRSSACCSVFSFCKRSRACCRRRDRSPAMATLLWLSAARGKARRTSVLSAEICTQRRFWSLMLSSKSWRRKETIAARPASSESESSCSRQMWCSTNCWYVLGCGIIAQARSSNWCVSGSSAATCARSSSTWLTALTGLAALLPFRGWRSCCWRSSDRRGSSRTAGAGPMRSIVPLHYLHPQPFAEERDGHFLAVRLVRAPLHLGLQRGNLLRADLWDAGCLRRQALEFRMPAGRLERVLSLHLASVGRT